eukprot:scaffold45531_cov63-Phaeocystis_antarctica.AAC.6
MVVVMAVAMAAVVTEPPSSGSRSRFRPTTPRSSVSQCMHSEACRRWQREPPHSPRPSGSMPGRRPWPRFARASAHETSPVVSWYVMRRGNGSLAFAMHGAHSQKPLHEPQPSFSWPSQFSAFAPQV